MALEKKKCSWDPENIDLKCEIILRIFWTRPSYTYAERFRKEPVRFSAYLIALCGTNKPAVNRNSFVITQILLHASFSPMNICWHSCRMESRVTLVAFSVTTEGNWTFSTCIYCSNLNANTTMQVVLRLKWSSAQFGEDGCWLDGSCFGEGKVRLNLWFRATNGWCSNLPLSIDQGAEIICIYNWGGVLIHNASSFSIRLVRKSCFFRSI